MAKGPKPSEPTGAFSKVPQWLWLLALLAGLLTTAQSFGVAYMGSGWAAPRGALGLNSLAQCGSDRFCAISVVKPSSPAARAGIVPGDRLRLDRYWERHRTMFPDEHIGVMVRHDGQERHVDLVTAARSFYAPTFIFTGFGSAAVCLIATAILARAGRRWWIFLLALSLIGVGIPGGYPRFWQNYPAVFPLFFTVLAVAYMAGPFFMLAALRGFRKDVIGYTPGWLNGLVWLSGAVALVATVWGTAVALDSAPLLGVSNGLLITSFAWSFGSLLGPLALAAGWRDVPAASRTRYAFMWTAVTVSSVRPIVDPIIITAGSGYSDATWPVVLQLASTILGALLFAYAILRHRVIDLGFAINRTIVYSTLSFLILIVFGFVEWASEKLLPFESHETSAFIEAGVGLILFLVLHHVHAWIEGLVERLFFHRWHTNEKALRLFLHQASYVTRPEILIERSADELKRFTGGADVALYRATPGGYALLAGDTSRAPLLDSDLPALVSMRADRAVVRDTFVTGDIALPMTHRMEVTGFVVLGPKPAGDGYRPDEEALLAEAVSRIGLDLFALRVEELQDANTRLSLQLKLLSKSKAQIQPEKVELSTPK